jgi:predicted RNase H-like HicB family nuclease
MRLAGRVFKQDKFWVIEVPILDIVTQGHTKNEAYEMIADAIESLVNREGFHIQVFRGKDTYFEVGSSQVAELTAFLLRRQRSKSGLTLFDVRKRLGAKSHNAYARYEQGRVVPTIAKLYELLSAVSPDRDFVLVESQHISDGYPS